MLQTHTIFSNVSKGTLANKADLIEAFGTDDQDAICLEVSSPVLFLILTDSKKGRASSESRRERCSSRASRCSEPSPHLYRLFVKLHKSCQPCVSTRRQTPLTPFLKLRELCRIFTFLSMPRRQRSSRFVKNGQGCDSKALEAIKALKERFPIERAQMSLRVRLPAKESKVVKPLLVPLVAKVDSEEWDGETLELVRINLYFN